VRPAAGCPLLLPYSCCPPLLELLAVAAARDRLAAQQLPLPLPLLTPVCWQALLLLLLLLQQQHRVALSLLLVPG
jgi:hypothetical protein